MKVKLQPPSATDLPAYNPILPPAAITQVMLLANPNKVCTVIFCSPALLEVYKNMLGFIISQNIKAYSRGSYSFWNCCKHRDIFH